MNKNAKTYYIDYGDGAIEGCGDIWKNWEVWCTWQYAVAEGANDNTRECDEVTAAWNAVNAEGFSNSISLSITQEGVSSQSSSSFGADFAKGAALGGIATFGALYALSKYRDSRKDADEGFHRI